MINAHPCPRCSRHGAHLHGGALLTVICLAVTMLVVALCLFALFARL